ncbi:MAG: hypothetical protein K6C12_03260 [Oscillospiraceae bacterium]|nr:hypothetical protein [Oscillospiraceae bacterium]
MGMIEDKILIDGVDITNYIAAEGVEWSRNDIDGSNAGRNLAGTEIRDRIATKIRLNVTCRPLSYEEQRNLMQLLYPEFVSVSYTDPLFGRVSKVMYCNKNESSIFRRTGRSSEKWKPKAFALVEK